MGNENKDDIMGWEELQNNRELHKKLFAEFVGTALLVMVACGSCLTAQVKVAGLNSVSISLCFGITVATIAQAIGHVSGAHLNPAVSFGLVAAGENTIIKAVLYTIVQCFGAVCGAVTLYRATPKELRVSGLGDTNFGSPMTSFEALIIECCITFLLVLTVCGVCDDLRKDVKGSAPLAVGLSITACHLFAIAFTGSSMNPARSFGPAVVAGSADVWKNHWVYWAGPISGGVVAGLLYRIIFKAES